MVQAIASFKIPCFHNPILVEGQWVFQKYPTIRCIINYYTSNSCVSQYTSNLFDILFDKGGVYEMKDTMEILRGLREDKDLKQSEIADLVGTTQQQYSKYETGESELPVRALIILADFYNVSADYLLGRTDCREGVDALNQKLTIGGTTGSLLSAVLSLEPSGQSAVLDYIFLQQLKQKYGKKK